MKLNPNHPALTEKRTINVKFRDRKDVNPLKTVDSNRKLGNGKKIVQKGKWKGQPMYALTLEERATCPTSCYFWDSCYMNSVFFAPRQSTEGLDVRLYSQLKDISDKYPKGFVVRLHVSGDFFSVEYVKFWEQCLKDFPQMTIFVFSARIGKDNDQDIHEALKSMIYKYPDRWYVRFSDNKAGRGKLIYASNENFKGKHFVCPEMEGKTSSCLDCMACLTSKKTVMFKTH